MNNAQEAVRFMPESRRDKHAISKRIAVRRFGCFLSVCMAIPVLAILVTSAGPLRWAEQIGGDEYFEVTKSLLWLKGVPLYSKVWNDQPPLFTVVLGSCFRLFGADVRVARAVAVCFGFLLALVLFFLIRKKVGIIAAAIGTAFLVASPQFPVLAVSPMLELPAMATGLLALLLVYQWQSQRSAWLLLASGLIFAAALQIKFTAAVLGPGILAEIALPYIKSNWRSEILPAFRFCFTWGFVAISGVFLLGWVFGGNYELLWASYFSKGVTEEWPQSVGRAFSFTWIIRHTEGMWGAFAGLTVLLISRDWRRLLFPMVMLGTVTLIHMNHRPWWPYYYLHFAVPIAWISGYGVAELVKSSNESISRLSVGVRVVAASLLGILLVVNGGGRLLAFAHELQTLPTIAQNPVLEEMKKRKDTTHWVYTAGDMLPFDAGLLVIPELAVIPAKRIWSGDITPEKLLRIVTDYRPELMLIAAKPLPLESEVRKLAERDYVLVARDQQRILYAVNGTD